MVRALGDADLAVTVGDAPRGREEANARTTEPRSGLLVERFELDLLREGIRHLPVDVIGGEHPTDDKGGAMRQLDPSHGDRHAADPAPLAEEEVTGVGPGRSFAHVGNVRAAGWIGELQAVI